MANYRRRRKFTENHVPEIDMADDDFVENMNDFLSDLKYRERSEHTIEYYDKELRKFLHSLEANGFKANLKVITAESINEGFVYPYREERGVKYATITATLRAVRAFLNWARHRGIISKSPMDEIVVGEAKAPVIQTFSREQIRQILSQPDPKYFVGVRDFTIMILMLETGIRVRELCDIKLEDIRFPDDQILIRGKNGEDRLVPIQAQTRRALQRYLEARGNSPVDWLFITVDDNKMNRHNVRDRIAKYGRMAGIKNVRCSPHTFRHTFAKMSVENGADIFNLQQILGHKTLDMVRRYVNMFSGDVKRAHNRFSPVQNLRLRF